MASNFSDSRFPIPGSNLPLLFVVFFFVPISCAFTDGEPWGYVDTTIAVDEIDSTSTFSINTQSARIDVVRLYSPASGGGAITDFDPANPPPGYTLCHGDHCHADDGRLVSYDEIIAGGAASTGPALVASDRIEAVLEGRQTASTQLKISNQTTLSEAEVELATFQLKGTIERSDGTFPVTVSLPVAGLRITGSVFLSIGADTAHHQALEVRLGLPVDLLDGIDVESLQLSGNDAILITNTSNPTQAQHLATRIREEAHLVMVE
ncbi:MAG: hypothetical protein ACNA8W_20860, partial [Bradymonadaceae bacterium]